MRPYFIDRSSASASTKSPVRTYRTAESHPWPAVDSRSAFPHWREMLGAPLPSHCPSIREPSRKPVRLGSSPLPLIPVMRIFRGAACCRIRALSLIQSATSPSFLAARSFSCIAASHSRPRSLPALSTTRGAKSRMVSTLPRLPLFEAISQHDPESTAVVHCLSGRSFKYGELLPDVARTRDRLYEAAGKPDLRGERIAFLVENSYDYVGMNYERTR